MLQVCLVSFGMQNIRFLAVYRLGFTHFTLDSDHILYDIVGVARSRYSDILLARCRVRRAGNNGKLQPLQKQRLQVGTDLYFTSEFPSDFHNCMYTVSTIFLNPVNIIKNRKHYTFAHNNLCGLLFIVICLRHFGDKVNTKCTVFIKTEV